MNSVDYPGFLNRLQNFYWSHSFIMYFIQVFRRPLKDFLYLWILMNLSTSPPAFRFFDLIFRLSAVILEYNMIGMNSLLHQQFTSALKNGFASFGLYSTLQLHAFSITLLWWQRRENHGWLVRDEYLTTVSLVSVFLLEWLHHNAISYT